MIKFLTPEALEGKVIERGGVKVKELIDELSKVDPEAFVVTQDCCHGMDHETVVYTDTLDYQEWWMEDLGLSKGDTVVVID